MGSPSGKAFAPENETFPPGVIFEPNDQQLVFSYLMKKVSGDTHAEGFRFFKDIDIYQHEPSELSNLAQYSGHKNMYFFTPLHLKGKNVERQVPGGFWKKTGNIDYFEGEDGKRIAEKTSLAYYKKKDPTSESAVKGQWLMKEYMPFESVKVLNAKKLCVIYPSPRKQEQN